MRLRRGRRREAQALACALRRAERYLGLDHPMADELALAMEGGNGSTCGATSAPARRPAPQPVAMRLHDRGKSPLMVPMYRVLDEIQRSFHDGGDPLKRYAEAGYLLIDDLGKRRPTGFVLDSLFQLIDQRYSAMRPTLVTTQYRPSDLVRRLAEQGDADTAKAIVSRLRHGARVVEFDGPDGRLAGSCRQASCAAGRRSAPSFTESHTSGRATRASAATSFCKTAAASAAGAHRAATTWRTEAGGLSSSLSRRTARGACEARCSPCAAAARPGATTSSTAARASRAEWRWRSKVYEEAWWTGQLLEVYEPHHPGLYEYGYWAITDEHGNEMIREGK